MKQKIFITVTLFAGISLNAQNVNDNPTIIKRSNFSKFSKKLIASEKEAISNSEHSNNQIQRAPSTSTSTGGWNNFTSSMNVNSVISDGAKPLQYNPNVNAVSFIHRKSPTYNTTPANHSSVIVAMISNNWGATWDSTCLYSDANVLGRYPQGAIYSAPGNTNIANAYIVGSGPAANANFDFIGSWLASKQLGTGNYNANASTVPNAMQFLSNTSYPAFGKVDYAGYSFSSTDDGIVRTIGVICDNINSSGADTRGFMLLKGSFYAGVFNWTGDSITPPVLTKQDGTHHLVSNPIMAWSQDGATGYVIAIGSRQGATGVNRGYQPIIFKTTNSGSSWTPLSGIDFSTPTFTPILRHLSAINNSTLIIPQFNINEGIDANVDMNGKLHLATTIVSTLNNTDSLDSSQEFTDEGYQWPHAPGARPYVYDFIGDGTGPWTYVTVDSLGSEGPGASSGDPGYADNPWDDDPSGKPRSDSRIQLSRTPSGDAILFTWAESDSNFTALGKKWNTMPNIKARLMKVTGPTAYAVNATEINVTKPSATGSNPNIEGKAMFHFASPIASALTTGTSNTVTLPFTVTNSTPYSQNTQNLHWYYSGNLVFGNAVITGVNEIEKTNNINFCDLYPNPANTYANVSINIKENAEVEIIVLDILGKQVHSIKTKCAIGENTLTINMASLPKGIYIVNVKAGNIYTTKKLIVE